MEKPETFIPRLCDSEGQCSLVYQQEICQQEYEVEEAVEKAVKAAKKEAHFERVWGSTIYHIDDLPMDPAEIAP